MVRQNGISIGEILRLDIMDDYKLVAGFKGIRILFLM